jgi:hypothetical protein
MSIIAILQQLHTFDFARVAVLDYATDVIIAAKDPRHSS